VDKTGGCHNINIGTYSKHVHGTAIMTQEFAYPVDLISAN